MTVNVQSVTPNDDIGRAAKYMEKLNIGAIPVKEGERVVGILTDRDIAIRAVAEGKSFATPVQEIMSTNIRYCQETDTIEDACHIMEEAQIRRLPVQNREGKMVGIITLGDIATKASRNAGGEALEQISRPSEPRERADTAINLDTGPFS